MAVDFKLTHIACSENGVATCMQGLNGSIVVLHCVCHRVQLAAVDAASRIKAIQKFKDDLVELVKYASSVHCHY